VSSLSSRSPFHWIIRLILDEVIEIAITDEILLEYEEVLSSKYSKSLAENFLVALRELPTVTFASVYYRWNLISDPDDNKFVDCYVAAGAKFLVSHDNHFNVLKTINFPSVRVVTIEEFKKNLSNEGE